MIKVKRMGRGDMRPSIPFLRELRLIDRKFDVIWLPKVQKFGIISPQPVNVFRQGYWIEYLVEKNGRYAPLDNRVLRAIRKLIYEKNMMRNLDDYLKQLDQEEEAEFQKAVKEQGEMETDFMKKVYKFEHETTFT